VITEQSIPSAKAQQALSRTPAGIVERLHAVTQSVPGLPDLIERLRDQSAEPMPGASAAFGAFIVNSRP